MKDVAREAGVSLGTVSKVINGIPVGESYRLRVTEAIKRLGYQVNNYARGLKTNRTNTVALLMPSLRHPFFAMLTDELTACLTRHGYRAILMITNFDPDAERRSFVMVRQNKADGVIALTYTPDIDAQDDLPLVSIDRHFSDKVPCVSSDNFRGGQLAAQKLAELGCKRLLFLRIGPDVESEADKRSAGFVSYCRRYGIDHRAVILSDRDTEAPFFRYLEEHIRDNDPDFDGIFCNTDSLACRVVGFLRARGIGVPEQVQVIGFDGIVDYATGSYTCSTIVQPIPAIAETAVRLLLSPERTGPSSICLPVRYAAGGTTREPAESEASLDSSALFATAEKTD